MTPTNLLEADFFFLIEISLFKIACNFLLYSLACNLYSACLISIIAGSFLHCLLDDLSPLLITQMFSIRLSEARQKRIHCKPEHTYKGEQGWCSGKSARLSPMCPGFDSWTRRHMWVEFVVGSLLFSERFFSGYSGFPVSSKTSIYKFQFDPGMQGHFKRVLVNSWCSVGKQITVTFTFKFTFTMAGNVKSE